MSVKNKVILIGHLGEDPTVKAFDSGSKNAKFSLATNEVYTNGNGETMTDTQWHNVVVWGKSAGVVERYLQKGSEIAIEGRLTYRSYEDKEGVKRYFTEIKANEFVMLGNKKQSPTTTEPTTPSSEEE